MVVTCLEKEFLSHNEGGPRDVREGFIGFSVLGCKFLKNGRGCLRTLICNGPMQRAHSPNLRLTGLQRNWCDGCTCRVSGTGHYNNVCKDAQGQLCLSTYVCAD